ncbi:MAG: hypothetical protein IT285_05670 [Bdellovibrionales bacterium]|nr:hypothetical protein [Bdellovibrionales bacterium]
MTWIAGALLLLVGGDAALAAPRAGEGLRLSQILQTLDATPAGHRLVKRAAVAWKLERVNQLLAYLRWGTVSKTDAVLTRHFDPVTGKEERSRQVVIYLRRDLPIEETVLDLAHEIVHAMEPPLWDPYDPELTATKYIQVSIEGAGGEVDAVFEECTVANDLVRSKTGIAARSPASRARLSDRCHRYGHENASGRIDRSLIMKDFYAVGAWRDRLQKQLGKEHRVLQALSDDEPVLYSSTGRTPYPVALLEEFEQMNEVACANSRRRESAGALRALASMPGKPAENARFLKNRCQGRGA